MNKHTTTTDHATKPITQCWRFVPDAILPGHRMCALFGPGKDTHGTPVPPRRAAVGGPTRVRRRATHVETESTRARHAADTTCTLTWWRSGTRSTQASSRILSSSTRKRTTRCRRSTQRRLAIEHSFDWEHNTKNEGLHCPSHQRANCPRTPMSESSPQENPEIPRTPSCPQWNIK